MSKPAARIGDGHNCPKLTPGTGVPHVGGVIIGPGCGTVLIEGLPAATVGDACMCVGEPDKIIQGSTGVFIGGKPAARSGDRCAHGGVVTGGCGRVLIGEGVGLELFKEADEPVGDDFVEPSDDEKISIINKSIQTCMYILDNKLKLLSNNDELTFKEFKKWFGQCNGKSKKIIVKRIRKVMIVVKKLKGEQFNKVREEDRQKIYAQVYPRDPIHRIFLGDHFWKARDSGMDSRPGILIHEISHFKNVGRTVDHAEGPVKSLDLAIKNPKDALFNADSFEYFMEA